MTPLWSEVKTITLFFVSHDPLNAVADLRKFFRECHKLRNVLVSFNSHMHLKKKKSEWGKNDPLAELATQSLIVGKSCIMETIDAAGMCFAPVRYCLALRSNCVMDVLQQLQTLYNQRSVMCLNQFTSL